ncbi:HEAT repeat domain-containing protein [Leptolyngbya sp. FACHB-671]|uniref:HEAT repeat domain-containing protein n=1 Tax=Leptolyngbya sp. FACHB-671 TaxID=2692812 RepID=UPI0016866196|nr:HEAT repeat domain-containing protein [Leptolyngbya sp. FACHB-671]MBD2071295.1 HEAT repeat domain-containing protein [Leptolyngbya sp. FACHB-671]
MWEWLAVIGTAEFTGFVFQNVLLKIGQGAMEDYVKGFFQDWIGSTKTLAQKKPVQEAIGRAVTDFLLLVQDELMEWGIYEVEIRDRYEREIEQFIHEQEVKLILGKAFEKDCKTIDTKRLEEVWQESKFHKQPFPAMPDDFSWSRIANEYVRKVRKIVRETPDLREILDSERLEAIEQGVVELTHNTAQLRGISPGFSVERYQKSLQDSYGYLRLNTLDITHQQYKLRLWKMFIPQSVREALPPSHYDLTKETQRRLGEAQQLESDLFTEDLERYKREYVQKVARPVLEVLKEPNYQLAVVVGDPGSGKSTLLQFLALTWAEAPNNELPLLVELREYTQEHSSITSFLEYFHQGSRTICRLERLDVDNLLRQGQARVMFDGLDEVFDPGIRSRIVTEIIRFTNEYPKVRVLVTSRIVGYVGHPNSERLQNAGFHQFTLQDLNPDQIQEFIDRWHDLALGNDPDRARLQSRLESAIKNSVSICELAGNPLLLTMMAILNRKQELPKDRSELYDQASQVLLYNWDVDYKSLKLPADAIGRVEKQAMLRRIAYEMQSGEKGLAGNLILGEKLQEILTDFLRSRGFEQPREKADLLIERFRDRHFILCFLGDDDYAFVHRTFLEYFCAKEFVDRLEKRRALVEEQLTEEQLKTEVFGKHWREESWHEVLRLISGLIGEAVAAAIIDYLIEQKDEVDEFGNLFLAAECLAEVRNRSSIRTTDVNLLNSLRSLTYYEPIKKANSFIQFKEVEEAQRVIKNRTKAVSSIAKTWRGDEETLSWLKDLTQSSCDWSVRATAVREISQGWRECTSTACWLKNRVQSDASEYVRSAALQALAENWKDDPDTLTILKERVQSDVDEYVRSAALEALVKSWKDDPDTLTILKERVQSDAYEFVRYAALQALVKNWKDDPDTLTILKERVQLDVNELVRRTAIEALAEGWKDDPDTLTMLKKLQSDASESVRRAALQALVKSWKDGPDTLTILKERVQSDADEYVRRAALQALVKSWKDDPDVLTMLKERVQSDVNGYVRHAALEALVKGWKDDPDTLTILKERVQSDANELAHRTALQALVEGWKDDPDVLTMLKERVQSDADGYVRSAALRALAEGWKDDPDVLTMLKERVQSDADGYVRSAALRALAEGWKDDPDVLTMLKERVQSDADGYVRSAAVEALVEGWKDDLQIFEPLHDCTLNAPSQDDKEIWQDNPRRAALAAIVQYFLDHPKVPALLQDRAENDSDELVRQFAKCVMENKFLYRFSK